MTPEMCPHPTYMCTSTLLSTKVWLLGYGWKISKVFNLVSWIFCVQLIPFFFSLFSFFPRDMVLLFLLFSFWYFSVNFFQIFFFCILLSSFHILFLVMGCATSAFGWAELCCLCLWLGFSYFGGQKITIFWPSKRFWFWGLLGFVGPVGLWPLASPMSPVLGGHGGWKASSIWAKARLIQNPTRLKE